uniref:Secretogranin-3 n=1 Tax=Cyprinus carpio TaxID=7962 RepID=A0A8C2G3W1_CYPCA
MYNRELTEEKPLEQQIAEADSIRKTEPKPTAPAEAESNSEDDDITFLKSLAEKSKESNNETPISDSVDEKYGTDEADTTKNRRLADDYDSTKNGMDYKYQDDPESFRQLDGTPLTAHDIVQKIANKIYEEDDRGVFDRIVSKLLKLGLITDSQAETLEYEVAEALQDLITKNAKDNMIGDLSMDYPVNAVKDTENNMDEEDRPSRRYDDEDEGDDDNGGDDANGDEEQEEEIRDDTVRAEDSWDAVSDGNDRNELNPEDGLQDLQFFPNFYRLLKSLDSEQDKEERETLITIMKTLIDFVKMMVKYGTITPEEGVSYLENLDAMIALQTKNKLGKSLVPLSITPPTGKSEHCRLQVIHCRFCSGRLWHHSTVFSPHHTSFQEKHWMMMTTPKQKLPKCRRSMSLSKTRPKKSRLLLKSVSKSRILYHLHMLLVWDVIKSLSAAAGVTELFNCSRAEADTLISLYQI